MCFTFFNYIISYLTQFISGDRYRTSIMCTVDLKDVEKL